MNEYIQGFNNDMNCISSHYNLSGLYGVTISSATGCFSSDTLVTLVNQQQIPIGKLQVGDELLSIDG
ncbi:unnamed protein product, partial [Rotaria sp. Silwood1]